MLFTQWSYGQCETWNNNERMQEAIDAHSLYREALKANDFETAYALWKTAYEIAPAADGKRDFHYMDGIKLYKHFLKNTAVAGEKAEYKEKITGLYEQAVECYRQRVIELNNCDDACYENKIGYILGRQAYDMYYVLNSPKEKSYEVLKQSVKLAGKQSEYIVVAPFSSLIADQYKKGNIDAAEAREHHQLLVEIVEYNKENNERFAQYYEQSGRSMRANIAQIESDIYDCEYFKKKLLPEFEQNQKDGALIKKIYNKLLRQGCDTSEAIMMELKVRYIQYADSVNTQLIAEMEARNPSLAGKRLYDEGRYEEAIARYHDAIEMAEETDKKAEYYFRIASIQGRKLKDYSAARSNARRAASLKGNWGQPYMLIGDLYAITSRNCGDSWNQRLAVLAAIDKYTHAKSIDPAVASEANSKISRYSESKPVKTDAFMRGLDEGQTVEVGCWIGETVKLRF